ncbi:DUF4352 domain-containing protein [Brachybacterium sp. YJGR34]|uniref:DUF4352 domain-containing protein n=1 Tax=Brachybacterium sp. YJGR34 TaxID=2059911 RepID=UPI000E0BE00C|nr:DUF4352 domain-containing protein [Brachybacterium sp. YJGR34]
MSNPYGLGGPSAPPAQPAPPAPPAKNRTPLYIGLACGCLLLIAVVVAAVGVGFFVLSDRGGSEPTSTTSVTTDEEPTEDEPTEDEPTEDEPTDGPIETPTDDPSDDPTEDPTGGATVSISVSTPEEGTTLETTDETIETENGKFIGVAVTITNEGDEEVGLSSDLFRFYDTDGQQHRLVFGSFSTSGPEIAPGEEATALLYADVPEDMELESVSYTDEVGTGGEEMVIPVG